MTTTEEKVPTLLEAVRAIGKIRLVGWVEEKLKRGIKGFTVDIAGGRDQVEGTFLNAVGGIEEVEGAAVNVSGGIERVEGASVNVAGEIG